MPSSRASGRGRPQVPADRPPLRFVDVAAVAAGGAAGALARYALSVQIPHAPGAFAWSTALINASGCLLIGVLMAVIAARPAAGAWRPLIGVGLLGGYTTFSGYALDAHSLLLHGRPAIALLSLAFTLATAMAAVFVGWQVTRFAFARRQV